MVIARKKYFIIPKDPSLFGLSHLPANWNKAGSLSWAKRQNFWSLIKVARAALTRFAACSHIYTNPWKLPSLAITCVQLNTQKVVFKLHIDADLVSLVMSELTQLWRFKLLQQKLENKHNLHSIYLDMKWKICCRIADWPNGGGEQLRLWRGGGSSRRDKVG